MQNHNNNKLEESSNNIYGVSNKMKNVVEDFEGESGEEGSSTLCYEDKLEKTKKERIK